MITLNKVGDYHNRQVLEIECLKADEKPIGTIDGLVITNGSKLHELDGDTYEYDEQNKTWVLQPKSSGGADGREIELQKTQTHIQWRYVGTEEWFDLVSLDDLSFKYSDFSPEQLQALKGAKGDKGNPGANGTNGKDGLSIKSTQINDSGHLILTFSDESTKDVGKVTGENGESAYQIAVRLGFHGTEQEWIESLKYNHSEEFTKLAEEVRNTASNIAAERQQITQSSEDITRLKEDKVDKPSITDDGKIPRANSGNIEWVNVGQPTYEQTNSAITNWLNEHPEATTTVQDGSITEQKMISSFLPYIKKDYITPQMFGAKGDGVIDDTKAIQDAIVFCENNKMLLYIPSGVYIISDTLIISKSIAIVGSSVHKDVLSSYNKYMGVSVLKFIAKSDKTLIVASEKAYDVSINSLIFLATSYEVRVSGNISVKGDCKKYYEYTKEPYDLNGINIEKTTRCSIDSCSFVGFSGFGIVTGQHRHITDCVFSHCNIAINCTNYDNLIHHCWFRFCSICIYSNTNNTLFLSDSWFDQIEQIAIKYEQGGFMMISNCEFDLIEYCAIYSKTIHSSFIQARLSRCGLYYGGFEPDEVPTDGEYKSCCIYSESISKLNNIQVNVQRREIKPGYGVAPTVFFGGIGMYESNLILDVDESHVAKAWNFENTNLVISGKQCKSRYSLKYNCVGCVSKDNENPNGAYYSIDVGDIYISTSGNVYISSKKDSNADWIFIGSKSV